MTAQTKISCQEAQELMPWLAEGGLEETVADRLRGHLEHCPDCRGVLEQSAELLAASERHLPAEWFVNLADGRPLQSADAELARQHLEHCASCRELLAMAGGDVGGDVAEPSERPEVRRSPRPRSRRVRRGWLAVAAMLLLSLGWFGTWRQLQDTRSAMERTSEEAMMSPMVEVPPVTTQRGDVERPQIRPGESPYLVLVLISEVEPPPDSATVLEIIAPDGTSLFSMESPRRDENNLYSVILPGRGLEPGLYRAEISVTGQPLERFEFHLVAD